MSREEAYPEQRHLGRAMAWLSGAMGVVSIVLIAFILGRGSTDPALVWLICAFGAAVAGVLTGMRAVRHTTDVTWAAASFITTAMAATFAAIGVADWLT
jgi:hypothetical protein